MWKSNGVIWELKVVILEEGHAYVERESLAELKTGTR